MNNNKPIQLFDLNLRNYCDILLHDTQQVASIIDMYTSELCTEESDLIQQEFKRLKDCHYLDHAGATLYSEKQLQSSYKQLTSNLFCNPHTSKTTEDLIDQVRYKVLSHFHTTYDDYAVVFVSGVTAALKTVAETFQFNGGGFFHTRDNHTSVLGMREVVQTDDIQCVNDLREYEPSIIGNNLIVFPAQSNFCGYKYPIVELVHKLQTQYSTFVCLDAASYCSTSDLDLTKCPADFVTVSFYKMFGYPTGLGALLVSRRGQDFLQKQYYGGGTVKIAMSGLNFHRKRDVFHERFEDGTTPFLSIISLLSGFQIVTELLPEKCGNSMNRISRHVFNLVKYLTDSMNDLVYPNGSRVIVLYEHSAFKSSDVQGGIVNFNVLHPDGSFVGYAEIAHMASIHNIYLRTGCFCNPGACQQHLQLTDAEVRRHFSAGHICGDTNDLVNGIPTGSVRVSFGYMSRKEDADALLQMIKSCYLQKSVPHSIETAETINLESNDIQTRVILKQICVYPLKSCAPIKVTTKWPLCSTGLKYDRNWMIVQANGMAMSQRVSTKLCCIQPKINFSKNVMLLQYPGLISIEIDLETDVDEDTRRLTSSVCHTKVCSDRIVGIDCGDDVADWLEKALGISGLRLINMAAKRTTKDKLNEISLTNQSQFLLINSASVRWLAEKVEDWDDVTHWSDNLLEPIVDRFRGNVIVESSNHLEERDWQRISIGDVTFRMDGLCARCQMICIDQHTGERTTEPLRTIAREFKGKMMFGVYFTLENLSQFIDCNSDVIVGSLNDKNSDSTL